jgi:hypothetical protein
MRPRTLALVMTGLVASVLLLVNVVMLSGRVFSRAARFRSR